MKIIIAKNAGFCPGVNNAIKKVIELLQKTNKKIYTLGPLIHNKEVIKNLEEMGIKTVDNINEIDDIKNSIVVIRAHGITPQLEQEIRKTGIEIFDATCPLVKKVHNIIDKYSTSGYTTVIVGDKTHAEVIGLIGYTNKNYYVVSDIEEAKKLPYIEKVNVVAQTTQEIELFEKIVRIIKEKTKEIIVSDTICTPTKERQQETLNLSKISDLVIVIGGKHSANTQRLHQITQKLAKDSILIENENEIDEKILKDKNTVFITAGASTPAWIIERVEKKIKEIISRKKRINTIFNLLVASGLFTGFAAFGLISFAYKSFNLYDINLSIATSLALMAVHIINRGFDAKTQDNIRNIIFIKNRKTINRFAYISILISIIISLKNLITLLLLLVFIIMGLMYRKTKNIFKFYGTKDIFIILGWIYMICFVPYITKKPAINTKTFYITFILISLISISRNIVFNLFQKYNDIIISNENIYSVIGEKNIIKLLDTTLVVILILSIAYTNKLVIIPLYYFIFKYIIINKKIQNIILLEFLTELPLILVILV